MGRSSGYKIHVDTTRDIRELWPSTPSTSNLELTIITSRFFILQQYEDTPSQSSSFSNFVVLLHQPTYPIQTIWRQSSSTTCCAKRILCASVLLLITISVPSCDILPRLVRKAIRLIIFSSTFYLLVVTLVPVWANMHRRPKTKPITTHIHLV